MNEWICKFCPYDTLPFCHIDDDNEFSSAIYSLYSDKPLDFETLDKLLFRPFEWNQDTYTPMNDMDPDLQYFSNPCYSNNNACDYFLEDTFNSFTNKHKLNTGGGISMISHNVRSISKHDTELRIFLENIDLKFDMIGLCETLAHGTRSFHLPNFRQLHILHIRCKLSLLFRNVL